MACYITAEQYGRMTGLGSLGLTTAEKKAAAGAAAAAKKAAADAAAAAKKAAADAAAAAAAAAKKAAAAAAAAAAVAKAVAAKLDAAVVKYAAATGWTKQQIYDMVKAGSLTYTVDPYIGTYFWSTQALSNKVIDAGVVKYAATTGWTKQQIYDMIKAGSLTYVYDRSSGAFSWSTQMISPKLLALRTAALNTAISKFSTATGWNVPQVKNLLLSGVISSVFDPNAYLYTLSTSRTTPKQEREAVAKAAAAAAAEKKQLAVEASAAARAAAQIENDVRRVAARTGWTFDDVWAMISQQTGMSRFLVTGAIRSGKMVYRLDPATNSFSFDNVAVTVANAKDVAAQQAQQLISQGVPVQQAVTEASSQAVSQLASQGVQYSPTPSAPYVPTQYLAPSEGVAAEEAAAGAEAPTDLWVSEAGQYQPEQVEEWQYVQAASPYEAPAESQPSQYQYGEPEIGPGGEIELGPGGEFEGGGGGEFGGLGAFSLGEVSPWLLALGAVAAIWYFKKGRKK